MVVLLFFVNDKYTVSEVNVSFTHAEVFTLKLCSLHICLTLLAIYRPPNASVSRFILELKTVLKRFSCEETFCITGDLNTDILCPGKIQVSDYLSSLSAFGLENTITAFTREEVVSGQMKHSCLDHIAVRAPNHTLSSCVITQRLARPLFYFLPFFFENTAFCLLLFESGQLP